MTDHTAAQQPELLTLTEAAELLRAPIATLRYWRHLGTGPQSFRLGRRVLYRRDDLHTWINTQHDAGAKAPTDTTELAREQPDGAVICTAGPRRERYVDSSQ